MSDRRGTHRKKIVPRFDPEPSARFVLRVLAATRSDGALIGRLAVWAWVPEESEQQMTKDMDIAVPREQLQAIRDWLSRTGLRTRDLPIGGVNVYYPDQHVNVDFIDRTGVLGDLGALYGDAVQDAIDVGLTVDIEEHRLLLVSPEYLIVMKLAAGEAKDEVDIETLLTESDEPANVVLIRELIEEYLGPGSIGRFEAILRRVGHPDAKSKKRYTED